MKSGHKSLITLNGLACLALLLVTGCDTVQQHTPHVVGPDEIPQEVRDQPRTVPTLGPGVDDKMAWMRLGDVPSKPTNFTAQPLIAATENQMANDRQQAADERLDYTEYGMIKPMADPDLPPSLLR